MDWIATAASAVSAVAAAVGLVYAALTIKVQVRLARASDVEQTAIARFTAGIDNLWRLMQEWESDAMITSRAAAAAALRGHMDTDEISDVLSFFETMGYLLRVHALDAEATWCMFSDWALPYWVAAKPFIERDREVDSTYWQEYAKMWDALIDVEAHKRVKPRSEVVPGRLEVDALLDSEAELKAGKRHYPRHWRRITRPRKGQVAN